MRRFYALFSLLPALAVISPAPSYAQLVAITIAPPVLPVYVQPAIPAPGYLWTPGYWAYGPDGYFWVPGTWVMPPSVGVLWTPGYWGWNSGVYAWNAGYWGPTIGFYGGVNYGFGYGGVGYGGGYWAGGVFSYNRTVNNFGGVNITNVYNKTVVVNNNASRVSFNGGNGGINARPTPREEAAMREQHIPATATQAQHENTASTTRENLASVNHGNPTIAATSKAGEFHGAGVVGAHGAVGAAGAGGAGGLAHGPGAVPSNAVSNRNTGALGNTGEPKGPGNANSTPNRANALATTGPAGAGGNAPNRELRQGNPGGGNPSGVANTQRGSDQRPAANAAPRPQAAPRAMMAPPRPQGGAPRPQGGSGGRPGGNHKPG